MRTTRRFDGAVSETSGMNATPTAGKVSERPIDAAQDVFDIGDA
jgi:hypothetical protein